MKPAEVNRLEQFYLRERQSLFTYALSLCGTPEAAEDLVHTVFAKLLTQRALPAELRPYVFRMIRNGAIDGARQRARHGNAAPYFSSPNGQPDPTDYARYRELETAMASLSEDERECVVLKALTGFSFREIAEIRSVPLSTAASWYRRALAKLRTELEDAP